MTRSWLYRALLYLAPAVAALVGTRCAHADPCHAIPDRGPMPPYLQPGARFTGPVVYVGDGDSLCVDITPHTTYFRLGGRTVSGVSWVEVRLADFYAPELSGPGGEEAKAALERIAKGRLVSCVAGRRSYDRVVASCTLGGRTLGDLMRLARVGEGGRGRSATPTGQSRDAMR